MHFHFSCVAVLRAAPTAAHESVCEPPYRSFISLCFEVLHCNSLAHAHYLVTSDLFYQSSATAYSGTSIRSTYAAFGDPRTLLLPHGYGKGRRCWHFKLYLSPPTTVAGFYIGPVTPFPLHLAGGDNSRGVRGEWLLL